MSRLPLFVVVAPGLERLAASELTATPEIAVPEGRVRVQHGGLDVQATTRQLYAIHRWARIPTRVLVRVATGTARRWDELQHLVRSVDWDAYATSATPVLLHVASHRSVLYHEGAIVERVAAALDRPDGAGAEAQAVHVRLDRDRVVISVDASGELLHRRGWRSATHRAPMRTTLAAAMVRASGWDGSTPLVDPMAGSGTIPIEAASWAAGLPIDRAFAFRRWPSFEPGTWASVTGARRIERSTGAVLAADRDAGSIAAITTHVAAVGLGDRIRIEHAALAAQTWPAEPSMIVVNPPYGQRVGGRDLRDLAATLGRRVADGGHRLCLLVADDRFAAATALPLDERFVTTNGGIKVRCLVSAHASSPT